MNWSVQYKKFVNYHTLNHGISTLKCPKLFCNVIKLITQWLESKCLEFLPYLSFRGAGGCSRIFKTKQEIAAIADRFTGQSGHLNRDASFHYRHDMYNFEVMSTIIHNPQELSLTYCFPIKYSSE